MFQAEAESLVRLKASGNRTAAHFAPAFLARRRSDHAVRRRPCASIPQPVRLSDLPIRKAQHVKGALFHSLMLKPFGLSPFVFTGFLVNDALEVFGPRHPRERAVYRLAELEGPSLVGLGDDP